MAYVEDFVAKFEDIESMFKKFDNEYAFKNYFRKWYRVTWKNIKKKIKFWSSKNLNGIFPKTYKIFLTTKYLIFLVYFIFLSLKF